jgi:hypothetical protein
VLTFKPPVTAGGFFKVCKRRLKFIENSNLQSNSVMADSTNSSTTTTTTTNLPGVNNAQVIPSSPIYIKENSQTPTVKDSSAKK